MEIRGNLDFVLELLMKNNYVIHDFCVSLTISAQATHTTKYLQKQMGYSTPKYFFKIRPDSRD